jgi:hypothetical protein
VSIAFTYSGLDGERCACTLLRLARALVSTSYCSSYASNKPDEQRGIHQPRPTSIRNPSRKVPPTTRSSSQSRPWHRAPGPPPPLGREPLRGISNRPGDRRGVSPRFRRAIAGAPVCAAPGMLRRGPVGERGERRVHMVARV